MGGEDEQRYYRYAVARLAAFSNVMWDVTNEYQLFRNEEWAEQDGRVHQAMRPLRPPDIASTATAQFPFRTSPWADFAMYQSWDESGGYPFMLNNRLQQQKTGRPIPQINEEYGYEDHYPVPGAAVARPRPARRTIAGGWPGACTWPAATRPPANAPTPAPAGARTPAAAGSTAGATTP